MTAVLHVTRTYRFTAGTITLLEKTAAELGVSRNDLVRFLICQGLDAIRAGTLEVPTRPVPVRQRIVFNSDE